MKKFIYFLLSLIRKILFAIGIILLLCCAATDIEYSDPIVVVIMILIAISYIVLGAILSYITQLIKPHPQHINATYADTTSAWEETVKAVEDIQNRRNFLSILKETSV